MTRMATPEFSNVFEAPTELTCGVNEITSHDRDFLRDALI
jgi:hypothetical protein